MRILVSNLGSTSFKFRLFDMDRSAETALAWGGADRVGGTGGALVWQRAGGARRSLARDFADHGEAIRFVLDELVAGGAISATTELDAVAFKAVMAGDGEPVALVDDALLARMEYFYPLMPQHNPPYVAAMRYFRRALPGTPLVAALETGFHRTVPARRRYFAVPPEWAERYGVRRYGFHGASHRYVASRTAELMGPGAARRIISCHLGGSSSLCAIRDGASVATTMGLSAQSGLPQASRAGDFDVFALPLLKKEAGLDADAVLDALGRRGGLAALSGTSGDMRDILSASGRGDERAKLAMDLFATSVRDFLGAYLVELGGADAIVFTGGIGENHPWLRSAVCHDLAFAGVQLDEEKNRAPRGEARIESADSRSAIWVMPTNEELIVARQAAELLRRR